MHVKFRPKITAKIADKEFPEIFVYSLPVSFWESLNAKQETITQLNAHVTEIIRARDGLKNIGNGLLITNEGLSIYAPSLVYFGDDLAKKNCSPRKRKAQQAGFFTQETFEKKSESETSRKAINFVRISPLCRGFFIYNALS